MAAPNPNPPSSQETITWVMREPEHYLQEFTRERFPFKPASDLFETIEKQRTAYVPRAHEYGKTREEQWEEWEPRIRKMQEQNENKQMVQISEKSKKSGHFRIKGSDIAIIAFSIILIIGTILGIILPLYYGRII